MYLLCNRQVLSCPYLVGSWLASHEAVPVTYMFPYIPPPHLSFDFVISQDEVKRSGDTHSHFTANCIHGMLEAVLAGICFFGTGQGKGVLCNAWTFLIVLYRYWQCWSWRATVLQSLAPTLKKSPVTCNPEDRE